MISSLVKFFLENKLVAFLMVIVFVFWGLVSAPFDFDVDWIPRNPVAVDAIPDIGENQQIVFTNWEGRSPRDVEDQITYPLTTALLGIPGVKSVRSNSMFGFSSIYIIFSDDVDFYWSRSRILEKLNALPANILPEGVQPTLGPDATALGQIFWYTLEGRNQKGHVTGGWDLHELRTIQDYTVRYGLSSAEGVAEVASIGGYVKEYQVDVDPEAMRVYDISLEEVMKSLKESNIDVGAQTMEINLAEYFVRGLGYIRSTEDIERAVVREYNHTPITISDIAKVQLGPSTRRGVLDKSGAEVVGGVIVARYGSNPMEVINNVKSRIREIAPGLPSRVLPDGEVSQVTIVPFYDRTQLINETIGTLEEALTLEILVTVIIIILMLFNLRASILVSASLPIAVLMCFIFMRHFGVDANIVALSGIAIAIGTMVDMGIVLTESMVLRLNNRDKDESLFESIYYATTEVASAVVTAVATTIISFLPVFTMEAAEGKLFRPLAYTKTFALVASIFLALTILPAFAQILFALKWKRTATTFIVNSLVIILGIAILLGVGNNVGWLLISAGVIGLLYVYIFKRASGNSERVLRLGINIAFAVLVGWLLASVWMPLGVEKSVLVNFVFIAFLIGSLILFFHLIIKYYEPILRFLLAYKLVFIGIVSFMVYLGIHIYNNTGEEFMPDLDEGSFLLMPTSMPHSGMEENIRNLRLLDMSVTSIPEVESVVGKAGRAQSALDPAPMSMYENIIIYKSEYRTDDRGKRLRFKFEQGEYVRDENGKLIPDDNGRYYRQWRDHIKSPDDIWNEIIVATRLPGVTSAPKLQPIQTRLVMLQTGMRAPMGIKVSGTDLKEIEAFGIELEMLLKDVEGVKDAAVFADRIVGKPYLLLQIDRNKAARYGLSIEKIQRHIQATIGGMKMTTTVEGRERYNVRVRYPRELRNHPESLNDIYISADSGQQLPLGELVDIRYEQGPQSIKSEDGFLIGYVLFDKLEGYSDGEVVENASNYLEEQIELGQLNVPAGMSYRFAGNFEQQLRANQRLSLVLPLALLIIFLILYFQFRSVLISLMVFTGVAIAFAGGFIMIGLYNTDWFLDFHLFGNNMRDLFQIKTINLSVAVWVGFLALFGIATDDGVLVATFLKQSFKTNQPSDIPGIRDAVVAGGLRRVRPAMMTTATTLLALLPILTSTGRGADIMIPMAIPTFGGMALQVITMFTVPVFFALWKETALRLKSGKGVLKLKGVISVVVFLLCSSGLTAQSTDSLTVEAFNNNPALKGIYLEYQAALTKSPQVGQLPDPEIGVGVFPLPVETRLGAQLFRAGITQMLPGKARRTLAAEIEDTRAQEILFRMEAEALRIRYQTQQAYFNLYDLRERVEIITRKIRLFQSMERLILARISTGSADGADLFRIQRKLNLLLRNREVLIEKQAIPHARLGSLLGRSSNDTIEMVDTLRFAHIDLDVQKLLDHITSDHPLMKIYENQQALSELKLELNRESNKPVFGLGLDYIFVNSRNDAFPSHNGRDILQVRGMFTLPLNKKKYEAKVLEEKLTSDAIATRVKNTVNTFRAEIMEAISEYRVAEIDYALYTEQIKFTQNIIRIMKSQVSTNKEHFEKLLQLESELLDYEMEQLSAVIISHLAVSRINKLVPDIKLRE